MPKNSTWSIAVFALAVIACEGEGPAISENAAGEAPVVGAELEEDASLSDDVPVGEPEVMGDALERPADDGLEIEPGEASRVPPASRAFQQTPTLPGGESTRPPEGESSAVTPGAEPVGASSASVESGAGVFAAKCSSCHGVRGAGDTSIGRRNEIADLGSSAIQNLSDARLAEIIREGDGTASSKAHGKLTLTDEQVQSVIAWIRSL